MMGALRRGAGNLSASVYVILFVESFDRTSVAAPSSSPQGSAVDGSGVNSAMGSLVFAVSIAAVLVIGAIVTWKARKNRRW